MFDTPAHALWMSIFVALDAVAFVWLVRVVRRRRAKDDRQRATDTATLQRKASWKQTLDEREKAVVVSVIGSRLTVEGGEAWPVPVDLDEVATISIVVTDRSGSLRRYLELRDAHSHRVPGMAQGFDMLIGVLTHMTGFQAERLAEAMQSNQNRRFTLIARPRTVNAYLAQVSAADAGSLREQFAHGLCLMRQSAEVPVSWDVTYDDLIRMPEVSVAMDEYDLPYAKLGRVRVGALQLDDLRVRLPKTRRDVPVQTWRTAAVLTQGGDENYRLLKTYFAGLMDETLRDAATYEREDQNAWRWLTAGVRVGVTYWYDSGMSPESRYCSLSFENARVYPNYLRDAYSDAMQLEEGCWARFTVADVRVERNFRQSVWVRQTPADVRRLMPGKGAYVVWRDEAAGKIGFADAEFAVIADAAQAVRLELQNVSPGKGGGYAELLLVGSEGERVKVGEAGYRGFNEIVAKVAEVVALPVGTLREFDNS